MRALFVAWDQKIKTNAYPAAITVDPAVTDAKKPAEAGLSICAGGRPWD
jgi:hypothetical protein